MYKVTIGCETHANLKTKTKMFSPSRNNFEQSPNTNVNEIDLAHPGALPSVNKRAVELGIILANLLKMSIPNILNFDRKNYFYQDLPKGYQITQYYNPIGRNGVIILKNQSKIRIHDIHLEEDTAKQTIEGDIVKLDYNRAGCPLIEIVTEPDIHSAEECVEYLQQLWQLLVFNNISDGKLENGSFRVDINISLSKSDELGKKVEIKNINSFANIFKAIQFEITRQTKLLDNNEEIICETRAWNDEKQETISMRSKNTVVDYRYFPEPNIVGINIEKLIEEISKVKLITPLDIRTSLTDIGINNDIIETLINNFELYKLFNEVLSEVNDASLVVTWVVIELTSVINDIGAITQLQKTNLIKLIKLVSNKTISARQCKDIFNDVIINNNEPNELISKLGIMQINNEDDLRNIVNKIINENIDNVKRDYSTRPERVEKFIFGLVMKETKGQANPNVVKKIYDEIISSLGINA